MLKRISISALLLISCALASAQNFPDIPSHNWIYNSPLLKRIEAITGKSYEQSTRKELALAVYQIYLTTKASISREERIRERLKPKPRRSSFDIGHSGYTKSKRRSEASNN